MPSSPSGNPDDRVTAARAARAPTLTYLDSHCECTEGWLEPLLAQVAADRSVVACPVIDNVDAKFFSYRTNYNQTVGGFNWEYIFDW